jgi:hypothetical protein
MQKPMLVAITSITVLVSTIVIGVWGQNSQNQFGHFNNRQHGRGFQNPAGPQSQAVDPGPRTGPAGAGTTVSVRCWPSGQVLS